MRCAQCGSGIRHDPIWNHGLVFCSADCAEESALVTSQDVAEDEHGSGIDRLYSATDDDDF